MILGLTGYARCGKDTAAAHLVADGWTRVAFADRLKAAAYHSNPHILTANGLVWRLAAAVDEFGWEAIKTWPAVREYLQNLGVAMRTHIGDGVWGDAAVQGLDPHRDYVFTDVRFPNEGDRIRAREGLIVRITRPGVGPVNGHISETAMDDYLCPAIANDGTPQQLAARILDLVREYEAVNW